MNIAEIVENLVTGMIENLFETVENFSSFLLSVNFRATEFGT